MQLILQKIQKETGSCQKVGGYNTSIEVKEEEVTT